MNDEFRVMERPDARVVTCFGDEPPAGAFGNVRSGRGRCCAAHLFRCAPGAQRDIRAVEHHSPTMHGFALRAHVQTQ